MNFGEYKSSFIRSLLSADFHEVNQLVKEISGKAHDPMIEKLIRESQDEIGRKWESDEISLSQIYISGNICENLIEIYFPPYRGSLAKSDIGFVTLSDHHSLGMKIVSSHLNVQGVEHHILGIGLSPSEVLTQVIEKNINILLVSVLMLPSAMKVKELVMLLETNDLGHVKVIVGGAPFRLDPDLSELIGAHYTCTDYRKVLEIIRSL